MTHTKLLALFGMASLWCASPVALAAEPSTSPYQNCQNLKKIKDIDDLLYQMHSNLDGDCLFKIPSKKLAKIWGIPIFDYADYLDNRGLLDIQKHTQAAEIYDTNEKKPSLYITKWRFDGADKMDIDSNMALIKQNMNHQNVIKRFNGSLGQGKLPKYLPSPTVSVPLVKDDIDDYFYQQGYIIPNTEYQSHFAYCWFNQNDYAQNNPYYYISILTARSGIKHITLSNGKHLFQTQCKQNPLYYLPTQGK